MKLIFVNDFQKHTENLSFRIYQKLILKMKQKHKRVITWRHSLRPETISFQNQALQFLSSRGIYRDLPFIDQDSTTSTDDP